MFAPSNGAIVRACFIALAFLCLLGMMHAAQAAPTIAGQPTADVAPGERYFFQPFPVGIDPASVRFEIENKPSWLAFTTADGRLTGIPTVAATGIYDNIRISMTHGTERVSLPLFSIRVRAADARGQVSLSWLPPLENNDGSALTDLAGYRIYAGRTHTDLKTLIYIRTPAVTRWFINTLESGYHFFAVTAVNAAGVESALSPRVLVRIP